MEITKEVTAKRLQYALNKANMTARELANRSGVNESSISHYINGSHKPSNISSGKMSKVLEVNPVWLMGFDVPMEVNFSEKHSNNMDNQYYINEETRNIANEIYHSKELSMLFSEAKSASSDDLMTTYAMLLALKKKERGE